MTGKNVFPIFLLLACVPDPHTETLPEENGSSGGSSTGSTESSSTEEPSIQTVTGNSSLDPDPTFGSDSGSTSPSTGPDPEPFCGNGILEPEEECDQGPKNKDEGACTSTCTIAKCGDGLIQLQMEQCDDGNLSDEDGCNTQCKYTPRLIFVSSKKTGMLEIKGDPDDLCQHWAEKAAAANALKLGTSTFKALVLLDDGMWGRMNSAKGFRTSIPTRPWRSPWVNICLWLLNQTPWLRFLSRR